MVDYAPTKTDPAPTNGRETSAPRVVARSFAELMHDVLTLGDLQLRLAWADARKLLGDLVYPGVLLVGSVVVLISCIPIALATIAILIDETTTLTLAQSFAFTLAGALVVGAVAALAAVLWLRRGIRPFERSLAECDLNLRWIKRTLQDQAASGRPHAESRRDSQ